MVWALLGVIVIVLVAVAGVAGYLLAGRALRPVHVIASTARELSEQSLHRRIELNLPADELGELVNTFNDMLARLEASFDSLRRFTADAAHELRAPLTILRTEAEVALSRERPAAEYRESIVSLLQELERLSRTAEQLLLLARADAGSLAGGHASVDLTDLVEETVDRWRAVAATRAITVSADAPGQAVIQGDNDLLRRMLDNLIDNAIRHAPDGGRVTVALADLGGTAELSVTDSGSGVDPALRETVFERFTRADPARQRETGGAGLGLALCAAIAQAHGGSIRLDAGAGAGARFVVRLPILPA
jgi:heavy metal sensor kinase